MAETVRKNLGMVTAYAYAVSKGYTGTEEEFAELMASYADVAQDAEASSQAAAQSATTAEQKATQAAGSATNAAVSATSASESAQAAAGSSNSANLYAQNASANATNAAGSASSASTYAGNASASAQAAQASATQAAGSADDAEAAKDLVLGMNAVAETLPAGSQATASYSNGTLTLGIPKGDTGEKGDPSDTNDAPLIYSSASGSVANFTDGADDLPMKSAVVSIESIQEGEGDPSPENIRPISGRTGLSVVRTGKNLLPANSFTSTTKQGLTYTVNDDGTVSVSGTATASSYIAIQTSFPEDVIINGVPEINGVAVTGTSVQVYSDVSGIGGYIRSNDTSMVIPANCTIVIRLRIDGGTKVENALFKPMARISADTDYSFEPYKGSTYSVNWETEAGTVYGGYVDVVSGKLTVDHIYTALPPISGTAVSGSVRRWYTGLYSNNLEIVACDSLRVVKNYESVVGTTSISASRIIVIPTWAQEITTVAEFNALLSEHPVNMVIRTAAHTEIQLTPQEIRTLLGVNNVWSDADSMAVEYPADTKTYIDAFSIKTVEVSGQTPTIAAEENTRYICGEVTSLTFTPCASGICDVRFTAASISTVLTLPETVKLPDWFDPTALEANTTYEINIVDGVYGAVMSWA